MRTDRLLTTGKHTPKFEHSGHMEKFIVPSKLTRYINAAILALADWKDDFDAVAFQGMSGAMIAPPIALAMGKTMILVRKEEDTSHAVRFGNHKVEGDRAARNYIILDDFSASGATRVRIEEAIKVFAPHAQCLGLLPVQQIDAETLRRSRGRKYPLEQRDDRPSVFKPLVVPDVKLREVTIPYIPTPRYSSSWGIPWTGFPTVHVQCQNSNKGDNDIIRTLSAS